MLGFVTTSWYCEAGVVGNETENVALVSQPPANSQFGVAEYVPAHIRQKIGVLK